MGRSKKNLTAREYDRGWVEHHSPEHGWLVSTTPNAAVVCGERVGSEKRRCAKRARRILAGAVYDPRRDPRRNA